jgi:alkylhydroperoxidase/carboxymuconolactone decarboxylase family protein YurZ
MSEPRERAGDPWGCLFVPHTDAVAIVLSVADEQMDWSFPWFEGPLDEVFPALHSAQNAWMSQIDSLKAPDRKTHELIRMVCTVILRNPPGVRRHAMLAKEVGASWDEILGSIMLTLPGFGLLPAVEAIPHARAGFDAAPEPEEDV